MKIAINTDVLSNNNLTLGEFLLLLMGYYEVDYTKAFNHLVEKGLIEKNLFKEMSAILSNNSKDLVAKVLMESDDRAIASGIDFTALAEKLQDVYPKGIKPGTSYEWRCKTEDVAQKLRVLVVKYDFCFTEEEAIAATKEYIESFEDNQRMHTLKNFILTTRKDSDGEFGLESMFMTIIENNREEDENNNR